MLKKITLLIALVVSFNFVNADMFFSFQPEVTDSKASALGRATVLTCTSSNAIFANPAGLSFVDENTFQLGFRCNWGSSTEDFSYENYTKDPEEMTYKLNPKINHFSFAMPLNKLFGELNGSLSIGYRTFYDRRFSYTLYDYTDDTENENESSDLTVCSYGGFNTLSIGTGMKLTDNLRLGFAANLGILSEGYHKWKYDPKLDFIDNSGSLDYSFCGNFYICGLIYRISEALTFGLTYRPGFKLTYKYETINGTIENGVSERRANYQIPGQFALSAKFSTGESTHIYLEYQTCYLSDYQVEDTTIWEDSEAGISLHTGLEFGSNIPIRLGLFYTSLPVYNQYYSLMGGYYDDESPNPLIGITSGINLPLNKRMNIDVAGEYAFISSVEEYNSGKSDTYICRYRISATLSVLSPW